MAEKALKEAQTARIASEKCCAESTKNAQWVEDAASRAENAMLRAQKAAKDADYSAHRAEVMTKNVKRFLKRSRQSRNDGEES